MIRQVLIYWIGLEFYRTKFSAINKINSRSLTVIANYNLAPYI